MRFTLPRVSLSDSASVRTSPVAAIFPPILQQAGAAAVRRDGGELGLRRERHLPDLAVGHEAPRRHPLLLHATGPWRRRRLRVVARHCRRHEARHCA